VPAGALSEDDSGDWLASRVERLAREGIVRRGSGEVIVELLEPLSGEPSGVLDSLLEERRSGR